MMAAAREWLCAVVAVTLLLAAAQTLIPEGAIRRIASFVGGLILLVTLLRPGDERWQAQLAAAAKGRSLTFRQGQFSLGGLVVRSAGLGLQVDASFDTSAQELSGHFAELFGLSLSDE